MIAFATTMLGRCCQGVLRHQGTRGEMLQRRGVLHRLGVRGEAQSERLPVHQRKGKSSRGRGKSVGFKRPALALIAKRTKYLDMRLANDPDTEHLQVGSEFLGCEGDFEFLLRVAEVSEHADAGDAWAHYHRLGEAEGLFPPEWQEMAERRVNSSTSAATFFYSLFKAPKYGEHARVRVFRLEVVTRPAALPSYALRPPFAPGGAPGSDTDRSNGGEGSAEGGQRGVGKGAGGKGRGGKGDGKGKGRGAGSKGGRSSGRALTPEAGEAPAATAEPRLAPSQMRVHLVLSRNEKGRVEFLCRRTEDRAIVVPHEDVAQDESPRAAARRLAASITSRPARLDRVIEGAPMVIREKVAARVGQEVNREVVVAAAMKGLPLEVEGGRWVWVDGVDLPDWQVTAQDAARRAMAQLDWPRVSRPAGRSPAPQASRSARRREAKRSEGRDHTKLGSEVPSLKAPLAPLHLRRMNGVVPAAEAWHAVEGGVPQQQIYFTKEVEDAVCEATTAAAERHMSGKVTFDPALLEKIVSTAKRRARARGTNRVSVRDVEGALAYIKSGKEVLPSPADVLPKHYEELVLKLRAVGESALSHQGAGLPPPKVLIAGETSGRVATMFKMAGADVATCDLQPSECAAIPHFIGDAALIQDLGWDLVIAHPPCTYLTNAGVSWLSKDPGRSKDVAANAEQFRAMRAAKAPFVAVENPKMHALAQRLTQTQGPTQYVHPWQHGTGHTKVTGLYLSGGLPPLQPTCEVEGREHAMARLPPSPQRGELRSRTYVGVAAAMALQWMPVLLKHVREGCSNAQSRTDRPSAKDLVKRAGKAKPVMAAKALFVHHDGTGKAWVYAWRRRHEQPERGSLDLPGGRADPEDGSGEATLRRELSEEVELPPSWRDALDERLESREASDERAVAYNERKEEMHYVSIWAVPLSAKAAGSQPTLKEDGMKEAQPFTAGWKPAEELVSDLVRFDALKPYAYAILDAVSGVKARAGSGSSKRSAVSKEEDGVAVCGVVSDAWFPWLRSRDDSEPLPRTEPRRLVKRRGRWCAWSQTEGVSEQGEPLTSALGEARAPTFAWKPLSEKLQAAIKEELAGTSGDPQRQATGNSKEPQAEAKEKLAATPGDSQCAVTSGDPQWQATRKATESPSTKPFEREAAGEVTRYVAAVASPATKELWKSVLDLWAKMPGYASGHDRSHVGLGASTGTPRRPALPRAGRTEAHKKEYRERFVSAEPTPTVAAATFSEEDIVVESDQSADAKRQCLQVRGVSVCRQAKTRQSKPTFYVVDVALMIRRVLADTGAGPSIITTGLLASMPADACVSRDSSAHIGRVDGIDGQPLLTHGVATIVFDMNGTPCRHTFIVVEGGPLLLLGNDFLDAAGAEISLGANGDGEGSLLLTRDKDGQPINRRVGVSCQLNRAAVNAAIAKHEEPLQQVALAAVSDQVEATEGMAATPTTPAKLEAMAASGATALPESTAPTTPTELADQQLKRIDVQHLLFSTNPIVVPPKSQVTVWLQLPLDVVHREGAAYYVSSLPWRPGLSEGPPVEPRPCTPDEQGCVPVTLANPKRMPWTIPSFAPVAALDTEFQVHQVAEKASGSLDALERLTPEQKKLIDEVVLDPQGKLSPLQRHRVRCMLAENITVFAPDPKDPAHTHLMEVDLPLIEGARPHRHSASRLGEAGRKIVDEHCAEMESRNIIRKSNSPWGSRVVLVTKKDGSIRFCVDFRDLNAKLKMQDSPIPLTVEAIDRLSTGKGDPASLFLSTLDLASGFWTLPIAEQDKEKTAFVTHRQKYEFNYLPFGIQSGPSYMCRLMEAALQGLAWEVCMPYLDDNAVWSTGEGATPEERQDSSFEQMMQRLSLVFERFRWAGMSCKAKKCTLFATETEYLGHVIGRNGLSMDPKKIAAVSTIDPKSINSLEKVRSFLGLCSYYRRFVAGFAQIAAPLTDLTKAGVDVPTLSQSDECQAAVRALIASITSEPVLTPPRFDRDFIVKTDAANTEGIGGVLSQLDDEGHERVNAYYGRRLTAAERHWTVTEIELLAALKCIKNWRPYLWGRKFKLIIDHAALRWLHTMRDTVEGGPASRLMRWILVLSEYNFSVEHKPGVLHKDADGVSRLVCAVVIDDDGLAEGSRCRYARPADEPIRRRRDSRRFADWGAVPERQCRQEVRRWAMECPPSSDEFAEACAAVMAAVDGEAEVSSPKTRRRVVTARALQLAARQKRQSATSRTAILQNYLCTGAPNAEALRRAQCVDDDCQRLKMFLFTGSAGDVTSRESLRRANWIAREARRLEVRDGLLYKRVPVVDAQGVAAPPTDADLRMYVPDELRWTMLTAYHDHLGHLGGNRMARVLKRRYYWPGLEADARTYASECHECTLAKHPPRRPAHLRGPTVGAYPFDLLYVDVLTMAPTHDYVKGEKGYDKLLVFVDSLSRWVEAMPFNGEPSSEQVLDAFLTGVVARHGTPRTLRSDCGSNVASDLCAKIMAMSGVELAPSTKEHHQSIAAVERFHATLEQMTITADEGGLFWADHLPFLLMSYRATPHRVTGVSPAAIVYGRELRLPAQASEPHAGSAGVQTEGDEEPTEAVRRYAARLNGMLVYAWRAAREATREVQAESVSDAARQQQPGVTFKKGDFVCRRLYESANKLSYHYAGPYRVTEVLPEGRYRLGDLENNLVREDFHVSNLRAYRTWVDAEELQNDEFIVDYLMDHRDVRGYREYRVKWRNYPQSQATWEPRRELERRCSELVAEYEGRVPPMPATPAPQPTPGHSSAGVAVRGQQSQANGRAATAQADGRRPPSSSNRERTYTLPEIEESVSLSDAPTHIDPVREPHLYESDAQPSIARYNRDRWWYGRNVATPRGRSLRWFLPKTFTQTELESPYFESLRAAHTAGLPTEVRDVLAAWHAE